MFMDMVLFSDRLRLGMWICSNLNCSLLKHIVSLTILRFHVTSSILGERKQQRKQWLSVESNRWGLERIYCYFKNNEKSTLIIIM